MDAAKAVDTVFVLSSSLLSALNVDCRLFECRLVVRSISFTASTVVVQELSSFVHCCLLVCDLAYRLLPANVLFVPTSSFRIVDCIRLRSSALSFVRSETVIVSTANRLLSSSIGDLIR